MAKNPMAVKTTGSPLKTVTGQFARDLRAGDLYINAKGSVLFDVLSVEFIGDDIVHVKLHHGTDPVGVGKSFKLVGKTVVATRRSITDAQAARFFSGDELEPGWLDRLYAHLKD